jgi:hypothetical protein
MSMDRLGLLEYARRIEKFCIEQDKLLAQVFEEIEELEQAYSDELNGKPYLFRFELLQKAQKVKADYKAVRERLQKELES